MKFYLHRRAACVLALAALLFVIVEPKAHAYIDPGTGSYVLQAVAAIALAAIFAVKTTWRSILATLGRVFSKRQSDE